MSVLADALSGMPALSQARLREVPVALVLNGVSHVVMLASPHDLEDFARGFLLSEGLVPGLRHILDIEEEPQHRGIALQVTLSNEAAQGLLAMRRNLSGRTGCGLCGVAALEQAMPELPVLVGRRAPLPASINRAVQELRALQARHRESGGMHAAGFFGPGGEAVAVREDVGRHNALDKLIGALHATPSVACEEGFLLLTSRCSHELVMKVVRAGFHSLVCLASPTDLAVSTAAGSNLNLLCRLGEDLHYFNLARTASA